MKRNTKAVGDLSEAVVLAELIQAGYKVSLPFGEGQRYDLILDNEGVLSRVQVKTGRLRNGAILFNCYSVHADREERLRTYRGA
ncbi:MAG TPA: group I intron-associated PD-(D/E)XK endonuclease, partial [Candidatus Cybelea sp.]